LNLRCGQLEHAISILVEYVNSYPSEADLSVVDLLATIYMENNAYDKAIQLFHSHSQKKPLPANLVMKEGICHLHLGNSEKAEVQWLLLFLFCAIFFVYLLVILLQLRGLLSLQQMLISCLH